MKLTLTTFLVMSSILLNGQTVSENLVSMQKKFTSFWSAEAATITATFSKIYEINKSDTSFVFLLSSRNVKSEAQGYSVGASVFDKFAGVNVSSDIKLVKSEGDAVFDKAAFFELYDCINKVYVFSTDKKKAEYTSVCSCSVNGVSFGGENNQGGSGEAATFYFKFDDSTSYQMNQSDFREIIKALRETKNIWQTR